MSAVTMSGESNPVRPTDTRGETNDTIRIAPDSPAKAETLNALKEPAAIVDRRLERLAGSGADRMRARTKAGHEQADSKTRTISHDNPSKSMLANKVQAQIASVAEISILAQAKQLPNEAMAFSASE